MAVSNWFFYFGIAFCLASMNSCINSDTGKSSRNISAIEYDEKKELLVDSIHLLGLDSDVIFKGTRLYPSIENNYDELVEKVSRTGVALILKSNDDVWVVLNDAYLFQTYIDSLMANLYRKTNYLKTLGISVLNLDLPFGGVMLKGPCDSIILEPPDRDGRGYYECFAVCGNSVVLREFMNMSGSINSWLHSYGFRPPLNLDNLGKRVKLFSINDVAGSWLGELEERPAVLLPMPFVKGNNNKYEFLLENNRIKLLTVYYTEGDSSCRTEWIW